MRRQPEAFWHKSSQGGTLRKCVLACVLFVCVMCGCDHRHIWFQGLDVSLDSLLNACAQAVIGRVTHTCKCHILTPHLKYIPSAFIVEQKQKDETVGHRVHQPDQCESCVYSDPICFAKIYFFSLISNTKQLVFYHSAVPLSVHLHFTEDETGPWYTTLCLF